MFFVVLCRGYAAFRPKPSTLHQRRTVRLTKWKTPLEKQRSRLRSYRDRMPRKPATPPEKVTNPAQEFVVFQRFSQGKTEKIVAKAGTNVARLAQVKPIAARMEITPSVFGKTAANFRQILAVLRNPAANDAGQCRDQSRRARRDSRAFPASRELSLWLINNYHGILQMLPLRDL